MIARVLSILGVIIFCFGIAANAQKYNVKNYSVNSGLPSSQVYDVHTDDKGLAWFATDYGLAKFDGFNIETYNKSHGLKDELIYDIYEDSQSRFWVSTWLGGVGLFDGDSAHYLPEFDLIDSLLVNFIIESPNTKELWLGTSSKGIRVWDGDSSFHSITMEDGLPDSTIWDISFTSDGRVWVSTMNGVAVLNEEKEVIKTWQVEDGLSGASVYQVYEASDGTLWLPTSNGITLIKGNTLETITSINGKDLAYVYNIAQEDDGTIWIGTQRDGLYWFDGENYTHITKKNGLTSNYIYRLIEDRDGQIWVATDGNGVSLFRDKQFKFFDHTTNLNASSVFSLFIDRDDVMWIGGESKISSYKDGEFKSYEIPADVLDEQAIYKIDQLPNGNLLILSYDYWLIEFDGTNFKISEIIEPLMDYFIMDYIIDEDGTIWFAVGEGLIRYKNGEYELIKPDKDDEWKSYVTRLFRDSKGNLWLGTEGGAAKYNGVEFEFFSESDGLNGQSVYEIKEDKKGNIWIGTNRGISVLKNTNEVGSPDTIMTFENESVFLSETMSLLLDDEGGIWQGTNGGLNYYDADEWMKSGNMNTKHFPLQDYGNGVEFNGGAALKDKDDNLWFGTAEKGLLKFDATVNPKPIDENPPHIFIRNMLANGEIVYDQDRDNKLDAEKVFLKNDQNNIEIHFGAVNFEDPYRIFYKHKLHGFEDDWITSYDQRRVNYTNLDPGEYTFAVLAKSSTSDWTETASVIHFEIESPIWQKAWFIVIVTLFIAALVVLYIKVYLNFAEKKKLKVLVDEQTQDLSQALVEKEVLIKEIHHRVKNNMAVISGLLELQSWDMEEGEARDALEDSKLRIKTMATIHEKLYQNVDLSGINFKDFAEDLVQSVSNSLKGMQKNIDVSMDIDDVNLDVNAAIPCGLMLNELVSNSFEHAFNESKEGTIKIYFKDQGEKILFRVKDDGAGIPQKILNSERTSLGITLVESLSSQIEGELDFDGSDGTTVSVVFPKQK